MFSDLQVFLLGEALMFVGRKDELNALEFLRKKESASLVCVLGRRRIGKSTLIEEFGKSFKSFFTVQGLAPGPGITAAHQLEHFSRRLAQYFKKDPILFSNWQEAFSKLASYTQKGETLLFLDEISWMAKGDPTFSSCLKEVWDLELKKNSKLILVVCGSVSTWIEDNILKNMSFEGRISLEINLQELALPEINQLLTRKHFQASSFEKMFLLSVTGGVPKYLEEVLPSETAERNLLRLCFSESGILFNDYSKIFTDIFERRASSLEAIVRKCIAKKYSPQELAQALHKTQDGELSSNLRILELSGFLCRDYYYKPDGSQSKLSHLRVKDNYVAFYLRHIEPVRNHIMQKSKIIKSYRDIKNIEAIFGYQFENLILANRNLLFPLLGLETHEVAFAAPYKQSKLKANKGACQVDLLIANHFDTFFVCEFKCKKVIDKTIITEVQKKCELIKLPRRSSVRPVLVYEGELYPPHADEIQDYFFRTIHFSQLLNAK
jgi:AAA+ ATPase superfamily predicted ATPase